MSDTSKETGRQYQRRPSATHLLGVGLLLNLALVGYLLYRLETRGVASLPATSQAQAAVAADPLGTLQPVTAITLDGTTLPADPPSASAVSAAATPDLAAMMQQLQLMQSGLQAMSGQIQQWQQAVPAAAATPVVMAVTAPDIAGMMAEIEQLYQLMQPLNQQIQMAMQSARPESELAAMRAQMEAFHLRLADLMARVEAARAAAAASSGAGIGSSAAMTPPAGGSGSAPTQLGSDQVTYQQLEQTLAQLQSTLQQMESGGTFSPMNGMATATPQPADGQYAVIGDASVDSLISMLGDMVAMTDNMAGMLDQMSRGTPGSNATMGEGMW